jgi:hypothetical protein
MQKISTLREVKVLIYFLLSVIFLVLCTGKLVAQNTAITIQPLKDISIDCGNIVPTATKPTATTSCKSESVLNFSMQESTQGLCPKVIIRLWTVSDPCGNNANVIQKIYIFDKVAPVLSGIPADITVSCAEVPAIPTSVVAKDQCDDKVQLYVKNTKYQMTCEYNYKIRREFVAIDRCGNIKTQTQLITVRDNEAPVFTTVLQNVTVSCNNIPVAVKPIATDNCSTASFISISLTENRAGLGCKDSYTIKRTWTAKDQCGKTSVMTQMITVKDTEKPVFTNVPQNITLECNELVPAATNLIAKDNCDTQVDILLKNAVKYGSCSDNYQIIREWTAADNCNNKSMITQIITINDSKAPVFNSTLKDLTVECSANITSTYFPIELKAKDNCDPSVTLAFIDAVKQLECSTVLTRTYSATDNCSNTVTQAQVITIKDTTPPTILGEAKDVTIDCAAVTAAPLFLAKDNCDPQASVQFLEEKIPGSCPDSYQLKRIWVATDKCGNKTTKVQIVTVNDLKKPVLFNIPADATMSCSNLKIAAIVTAEDNCDKNVEINFSQINVPNATCGYSIKRTWVATDNCANSSVKTQTISVIDTEKPTFSIPANVTVECDFVPIAATVLANDNCDKNVEVRVTELRREGLCPNYYIIARTWTATDKCGNKNVQTQFVTVKDTKKPILSGVPNDVTIGDCTSLPIAPTNVTATDNCDAKPLISFTENNSTQGCARKIQRTWRATDACGNSTSAIQNIYTQDRSAPTFLGEINDVTILCSDAVPVTPQPTIKDNCDAQVTVYFKETTETANCNTLIKRTWIATDACANSATKVQNITMIDTIKPVFVPIISDITVECGTAPVLPNIVVTDNCDKNPAISFNEEVVTSAGLCNSKVSRTWIATDRCGNSSVIKQIIWIKDSEAPVFVQTPASVTVDCSQMTNIVKPIVKDNCTDKITLIFKDETSPTTTNPEDTCTILKIRTWIATDLCGNTKSITQSILITDKIAPIVAILPKDVSVSCSDTIPAKLKLAFFDACSATVKVVYSEKTIVDTVKNNGSYILERKWIASDRCANAKVVIQNIYVSSLDIKPPVLITAGMPDQMTLECSNPDANAILQNPVFPYAKDDCDKTVQVTYTDDKILETCGSNAYIILRIWKATDDAGNTDEFEQFFNIIDETAPVIYNVPQDITIACGTTPPAVPNTIFAIDTCGAIVRSDMVEVNFQEVEYPGLCPDGVGQIKRFWTAMDSCENVTTKTQVITFSTSVISKISSNNTQIKDITDKKEIQEIRAEKIRVFPNPTTGTAYISLPKNVDMMLISNELGQLKYTLDNPREGINTVEMRDWNNGIYIIQIKMQDKIQTQKIFLQTH